MLRAESTQSKIVENKYVGCEQFAQRLFRGQVSARLVQHFEHLVGAQNRNVVAFAARGVAERAGEVLLADTDGPEEDDVLGAIDKAETKEVVHVIAVERVEGPFGVGASALPLAQWD